MSASFECNTCHHSYTVKKKDTNLFCPMCGSRDISEKSVEYLIKTPLLKKLIFTEIILIFIVLTIFILSHNEGLKIRKVESDRKNHTISVILSPFPLKKKMEYSFDNGKTYQNDRTYYVQQPGTYVVVVKDNKNRKSAWDVPVIFTVEDFNFTDKNAINKPPQITGIDTGNETLRGRNDGKIVIHTINGKKPIRFSIDGGQSTSEDSLFTNLKPGRYDICIIDDASRRDTWSDPVNLVQGPEVNTGNNTFKPASRSMIESKLNRLFADPDNAALKDSIQEYFVSKTMNVEGELIDIPPNTPYQLYQFLLRRYEGEPGTKRIKVLDIGYDRMMHINKLKIKETRISKN